MKIINSPIFLLFFLSRKYFIMFLYITPQIIELNLYYTYYEEQQNFFFIIIKTIVTINTTKIIDIIINIKDACEKYCI